MRVQRVILEHHRDVAIFRLQLGDRAAVDLDLAAGDGLQPRDRPQQGGFAAAGRADHDNELPISDIAGNAVQDMGLAKAFPNVF